MKSMEKWESEARTAAVKMLPALNGLRLGQAQLALRLVKLMLLSCQTVRLGRRQFDEITGKESASVP